MTAFALLLLVETVHADDVATIRDRFVRSVLPTQPADIKRVNDLAASYAKALRDDGTWADVHYDDKAIAFWSGRDHLVRTLIIAKSVRLTRDASLRDKALLALKTWTDPDLQNPNWWWNVIGVPELLGETTCLLMPDVPQPQIDAVLRIMQRSNWKGMSGANATWTAMNTVVRGCIEGSAETVSVAYARLYEEVKLAEFGKDGIQPDFSFHQHGKQFYNGSYGLAFSNDVGRFIAHAAGTSFQISPEKMKIFSDFMLDGQQWFVRGDIFDYNAVGREISRRGKLAVPHDWAEVSISPAGPAYSIGNVTSLLAAIDSPRQRELAAFATRLNGDASSQEFGGNKHFWCSDAMVHRRPTFIASVKMFSTRTLNTENTLSEGKKAHHLADGATFLYRDGEEYKDIFAVWDWNKVPGTTAEQVADLNSIEPSGNHTKGKTSFVGGVSDGSYGLCVMDLKRGKLSAHKAWFFFDDGFLCLGNNIAIDGGSNDVITAVNQSHLRGEVTHGDRWVHHDNTGYIAGPDTKFQRTTNVQNGRWSDIGAGTDKPVSMPVFNLWIDHGPSPRNAAYQYFILPSASPDETARRVKDLGVRVIENSAKVQAVYQPTLKLLAVAFWSAGSVDTPAGRLSVDQPCLVMIRDRKLSVSNPVGEAMNVRVMLGEQGVSVDLPGGAMGGSTVSRDPL